MESKTHHPSPDAINSMRESGDKIVRALAEVVRKGYEMNVAEHTMFFKLVQKQLQDPMGDMGAACALAAAILQLATPANTNGHSQKTSEDVLGKQNSPANEREEI